MEGHSGKPLYLIENPQLLRQLGIFVLCGTFVLLTCSRYNGGRKNRSVGTNPALHFLHIKVCLREYV